MQHYTEPDKGFGWEDEYAEEDPAFDLQCGDSLSIAVNHIGEDTCGVRKLLLRGLRRIRRSRHSSVPGARPPVRSQSHV